LSGRDRLAEVAGTDVTCPDTAKDKFAVSAGWIVPVAAIVERRVRVVAVTSRVVGAAAVDRVAAQVPTAAVTSTTATSPVMMRRRQDQLPSRSNRRRSAGPGPCAAGGRCASSEVGSVRI